jgi:hypothetical protein
MSLFNKDKKPTLKRKSAKTSTANANVKLSKYLPTSLFIGIKEDVNKKTLESYIASLSQSLFANSKEGKYSIKKLNKDKYIYEIHNGSNDLTYLPLVISKLIDGSEKEIILKTSGQNVRVVKKTSTRIETNTLIESNNRDEDALVDYETKGQMIDLVKTGTEFFLAASIFAGLTGLVASVSFLTKYYMLNADYSYNPENPNYLTAIEYLGTIDPAKHTETSFLKNIKFEKGKWISEFKTIPAPKSILTEEELNSGVVQVPESQVQYDVVNAHTNLDSMIQNNTTQNVDINVDESIVEEPIVQAPIVEANVSNTINSDVTNIEVKDADDLNTTIETIVDDKGIVNDDNVINNEGDSLEIKDSLEINENDSIKNEIVEPIKDVVDSNVEVDEFEILNVEDVSNLDISNLPDNVVVE